MRLRPPIQNSSRYFFRLKRGCRRQTLTSTEHHISSLHSHYWVEPSSGNAFPRPNQKKFFLLFFIIRECGSTLHVGLAHAVPPSNTKFKLITSPSSTWYSYRTQTPTSTKHHTSSLHIHFWVPLSAGSPILCSTKTAIS